MWTKKKQDQLEAILNYPGLSYKKLNKSKYMIHFEGNRWYFWPRSGRHQHLSPDGELSDVFMGELKDFYHRYLTGELQLPENFGKTWSKADEEVLYDMIDYACTIRQIAYELKRHPVSVVNKLAKYLDDDSIPNRLIGDMYDVPVRELAQRM